MGAQGVSGSSHATIWSSRLPETLGDLLKPSLTPSGISFHTHKPGTRKKVCGNLRKRQISGGTTDFSIGTSFYPHKVNEISTEVIDESSPGGRKWARHNLDQSQKHAVFPNKKPKRLRLRLQRPFQAKARWPGTWWKVSKLFRRQVVALRTAPCQM